MSNPQGLVASQDVDSVATKRGTITVLTGCMFAGKTTLLLRRLAGRDAESMAIFKHAADDRFPPDAVVTHGGTRVSAIAVRCFRSVEDALPTGIRAVAIDEGHFFDAKLLNGVESLAERGLAVYVTMLDRDCWGRVFPLARKLNNICDEIVMLHASCGHCGRPANRTQRLTPIVDGNLVGGPESYEARCLECWRPPPESPPPLT